MKKHDLKKLALLGITGGLLISSQASYAGCKCQKENDKENVELVLQAHGQKDEDNSLLAHGQKDEDNSILVHGQKDEDNSLFAHGQKDEDSSLLLASREEDNEILQSLLFANKENEENSEVIFLAHNGCGSSCGAAPKSAGRGQSESTSYNTYGSHGSCNAQSNPNYQYNSQPYNNQQYQGQQYQGQQYNPQYQQGNQQYNPQYSQYSQQYSNDGHNYRQQYTAEADHIQSEVSDHSKAVMTEDVLFSQLDEKGKATFRALDSEGKALALKLAIQSKDKNEAVKEAAMKMAEKRASVNGSKGNYSY